MKIIESIKRKIMQIFNIQPASQQSFSVIEEMTQETNVLKNRILYRGNAVEMNQFFSQLNEGNRFWAKSANKKIRKIHLGYVSTVIDRYTDIVCSDLNAIEFEDKTITDVWESIAKENSFNKLIEKAVKETLITGDGAFKIGFDANISDKPLIDFIAADYVDYTYNRGRLTEVIFYTDIWEHNKKYRLDESYGYGYVKYKLYDSNGNEIDLSMLQQTSELKDLSFNKSVIFAVPFKIFQSALFKNRGKALFDSKLEEVDALDEVASQWLDAIRKGRVKKYIPELLIPRDEYTGMLKTGGFEFDDDFVKINTQISESVTEEIQVIQPEIRYEAYVNSYANFLDMLLQGIISPSTLGIDLKKTDNAESQREKEKITCDVRSKIVYALSKVLVDLIKVTINFDNLIHKKNIVNIDVSVSFGEYASSDFASVAAVVADAHQRGIMSIERAIEELYGDTLTAEEKAEEVKRIKEEQGIVEIKEPGLQIGDEPINE